MERPHWLGTSSQPVAPVSWMTHGRLEPSISTHTFEAAAVKSGTVDRDHDFGKNNRDNVAEWKTMAKKVILGKKYWDRMKSGWNKAMEELTKSNGSDAMGGDSTVGPDFSFREKN